MQGQPGSATGALSDAEAGPSEDVLRRGIELLFFAYRDFTCDPDTVLAKRGLGRAHHRAIHFIKHRPGVTVAGLLEILQVTKQSLNRVLRQLIDEGLVISQVGEQDRRERNLHLSEAGQALEYELSVLQHDRVQRAFDAAGPDAVTGFTKVLEQMIDEAGRSHVLAQIGGKTL